MELTIVAILAAFLIYSIVSSNPFLVLFAIAAIFLYIYYVLVEAGPEYRGLNKLMPYHCSFCQKGFWIAKNAAEHERTVHPAQWRAHQNYLWSIGSYQKTMKRLGRPPKADPKDYFKPCTWCGGSGYKFGVTCDECGGTGKMFK